MSKDIKIKQVDHRMYLPEYGVPTIQLGCGGTNMMSVDNKEDGMAGVAFAFNNDFEIGKEYHVDKGKLVNECGAVFQILSTKKESLIILKEKIEKAIDLLEQQGE